MKTKELEKVSNEKITLMIHGKEREIKFGFSAWAKLEKEYGGIKHLDKMQKELEETPFEKIPHFIFLGLKDRSAFVDSKGNEYPEVTEENILDEYGMGDIPMITEILTKALNNSLPEDEGKKVVKEA